MFERVMSVIREFNFSRIELFFQVYPVYGREGKSWIHPLNGWLGLIQVFFFVLGKTNFVAIGYLATAIFGSIQIHTGLFKLS